MLIKSDLVHIDTANNIAMSNKATSFACPISSLGLLSMPTDRTLATCSSFGASEARDVSLFGFVSEVVDILAIFPQGHPLVVVTTAISIADTVGITDKERANVVFLAEVDHFAGGFVSHITNAPFCSSALLVLGSLQPLPSVRVFLALGLLFCHFAKLFRSLLFERSDTTTRNDHGLSCVCRNGCQMDFTQINRCVNRSRGFFSLRSLNTDVKLKAVVPDQATGTAVFRQIKRQSKGLISSSHWQDDTIVLLDNSLSRPLDRIEAFFSPGIFHLHLRMALAKLTCGVNIGKKGMYHHLHRLAVQCKLSFGCLLQFIATRPFGMTHSCLLVDLDTPVPDFCCFHLSSFQTSKQFWGGLQSTHTYCIHGMIIPWKQMDYKRVKPDGVTTKLAIISFGYPNIEEKSLWEEWNQRQKSSSLNAVSNMILHSWLWKRIWIMFMSSLVLLLGFHPQPLRGCSKDTPHAIYERSSRISRNFAGKSICGQVRIMLAPLEAFQQRVSAVTFWNVKASNRKGNRRHFHPNPLEGDGTSRAAFVKLEVGNIG